MKEIKVKKYCNLVSTHYFSEEMYCFTLEEFIDDMSYTASSFHDCLIYFEELGFKRGFFVKWVEKVIHDDEKEDRLYVNERLVDIEKSLVSLKNKRKVNF